MPLRPWPSLGIGLLVILSGCADGRTDVSLTAPQSTDLPSTTTTASLAGSTTVPQDEELAELRVVDPMTLDALSNGPVFTVGGSIEASASSGELVAIVERPWVESKIEPFRLWLLNLNSGRQQLVATGGEEWVLALGFTSEGNLRWVEANGAPGGFAVFEVDVSSGDVRELISHPQAFGPSEVLFLDDGSLAVFGYDLNSPELPRVVVVDLREARLTVDLALPELGPRYTEGRPTEVEVAWDLEGNLLYGPIEAFPGITVVDLATGEQQVHHIEAMSSWLDRLMAAWVPVAHAKGPTASRAVELSPDRNTIYLTGSTSDFSPEGILEATTPTGVVAVTMDTFRETARIDADIDHVTAIPGGMWLLGTGGTTVRTGEALWVTEGSGLFVLDPATLDVAAHWDPFDFEDGYGFDFSPDGRIAYAIPNVAPAPIRIIDLETLAATEHQPDSLDWWSAPLLRYGLGMFRREG